MLKTPEGDILAGTYFGLFRYSDQSHNWEKIQLPIKEERITDLITKGNETLVQTRSYLLKTSDLDSFFPMIIPAPENYDGKASLFKTLWLLHSGELWGLAGKLAVDLFGLVILLISLTGLLHFLFPGCSVSPGINCIMPILISFTP